MRWGVEGGTESGGKSANSLTLFKLFLVLNARNAPETQPSEIDSSYLFTPLSLTATM